MKIREPKPTGPNSSSGIEDDESSSFVIRLTKVLMCLSNGVNSVTDIARTCNFNTSTTHRILAKLKAPLLTVYEPQTHRYYLGPIITKLASNPKATHQYLIMCALNELKRLAGRTGETISLDLLIGIQLIHAYDIPSNNCLGVFEETEEFQPVIPLGAAKKCLLSQLDDKDLMLSLKIARKWDTKATFSTDIDNIKTQLEQFKQQGYVITRGEAIPGSLGISAPVKNNFCPVSLTILGPEDRLINRIPELILELTTSTASISADILDIFG